jgi:hypothetical protein
MKQVDGDFVGNHDIPLCCDAWPDERTDWPLRTGKSFRK